VLWRTNRTPTKLTGPRRLAGSTSSDPTTTQCFTFGYLVAQQFSHLTAL